MSTPSLTIKLPEIPRDVSPELYNYFVQLHLNLQKIVAAVNAGGSN